MKRLNGLRFGAVLLSCLYCVSFANAGDAKTSEQLNLKNLKNADTPSAIPVKEEVPINIAIPVDASSKSVTVKDPVPIVINNSYDEMDQAKEEAAKNKNHVKPTTSHKATINKKEEAEHKEEVKSKNTPAKKAPIIPLTNEQIAKGLAPGFNAAKDYKQFVKCYGTADFTGALFRIQAKSPRANKQVKALSAQIDGLIGAMQPVYLAAARLKTDSVLRNDYNAYAEGISGQIAKSSNPDAIVQEQLKALDTCRPDVLRWRGGK